MLGSILLTIDQYPLKAILAADEYGAAVSVQVPSMRGARDISARALDEDLLTMSAIGYCGNQVLPLGWISKTCEMLLKAQRSGFGNVIVVSCSAFHSPYTGAELIWAIPSAPYYNEQKVDA